MTGDTSLEHAIELISKETVQQFEEVRQIGACNMLDQGCVQRYADDEEMYALASLTREEYRLLLLNFGKLMQHYGITQEKI